MAKKWTKEYIKEYMRKYHQRPEWKEYMREYYRGSKRKEYMKEYRQRSERKEYKRKYDKEYMKERRKDPSFRLSSYMGTAIWKVLKNIKAGRKWERLTGYTLEDLMSHLEEQFDENMNWDNYGSYWSIDHKKPRSLFSYQLPEDLEFQECWALNNLQPMEKIENIRKSNHYET